MLVRDCLRMAAQKESTFPKYKNYHAVYNFIHKPCFRETGNLFALQFKRTHEFQCGRPDVFKGSNLAPVIYCKVVTSKLVLWA